MGDVYSIVGLPRPKALDKAYVGLAASDSVIAKVLSISEVAQIARAEKRLREYLQAKWDDRAKAATNVAVALYKRGQKEKAIATAVGQVMAYWAADVSDVYLDEFELMYKLARIAGWKKANRLITSSLQYSEPVTKAKKATKKPTAQALPNFELADEEALEALKKHQLFWIGDHYADGVSNGVASVVHDVMVEAGADRTAGAKKIAEKLLIELGMVRSPKGFNGSSPQYFEGLVANAATVARGHGQLNSFLQVGIAKYTVINPDDERTCERCHHMEGKTFTVQQGADQMHAELKAKTPDQVREAHPWMTAKGLKSISPKSGKSGSSDSAALAKAGQALPPYHFKCRCTIDVDEESYSYNDLLPMTLPTPDSEAEFA